MPPVRHRSVFGPLAVVATLLALPVFGLGCAGSLDPSEFPASGGSTGGTGSGGTGGTNVSCTGGNDGATIITNDCAYSGCHSPGSPLGAGLDLTVDNMIGSRLVGVVSPGDTADLSACGGNTTPYLDQGSNPATGLLIDKVSQAQPPCGVQMPYVGGVLNQMQQTCLIQWATTLTTASQ